MTRQREKRLVPRNDPIQVQVGSIDQLFNSMDPSPFRERELDRQAEEFIVTNGRELDPRAQPTLVIQLSENPGALLDPASIRDAIRLHFARRSQMAGWELRQLLRRGRKSLVIGLCFLGLSVIGSDLIARWLELAPLAQVLRQSLVIGGWVAMWGPMEIFLYEWWPIRDQRRLFNRLSQLDVQITDSEGSNAGARGRKESRWQAERAVPNWIRDSGNEGEEP